MEQDIKKGTFNPLKKKYEDPDFEDECKTILMMMMSECCREFERLPLLENVEILRNILYSGVWGLSLIHILPDAVMQDSSSWIPV